MYFVSLNEPSREELGNGQSEQYILVTKVPGQFKSCASGNRVTSDLHVTFHGYHAWQEEGSDVVVFHLPAKSLALYNDIKSRRNERCRADLGAEAVRVASPASYGVTGLQAALYFRFGWQNHRAECVSLFDV